MAEILNFLSCDGKKEEEEERMKRVIEVLYIDFLLANVLQKKSFLQK